MGLYTPNNSTGNTMPEGWVRLRLDTTGFPYTRLYKNDVISNTIAGLDVVIIPDMTTSTLINGSTSSSLPPEYRGGIGTTGEANLKAFVQNGGQLILMGRATRVPIDRNWDIGVSLAGGLRPQPPEYRTPRRQPLPKARWCRWHRRKERTSKNRIAA